MSLTTTQKNEITTLIIEGSREAYKQNLYMTANPTSLQSRIIESLIVINVAQMLLKWAFTNNYQVELEYPMRDFYNGAFPTFKWGLNSGLPTTIWRKDHNPPKNKSKRIDIAIARMPLNGEGEYGNPSLMSLAGIEIKSIKKGDGLIVEDIHRLSAAINNDDPAVGQNTISVCYSLFFRRLDKEDATINKAEIAAKRTAETTKWNTHIGVFRTQYANLDYNLKEVTMAASPEEEIAKYFNSEHFDYADVTDNSGLIVCYLAIIERKQAQPTVSPAAKNLKV